MKRVPDGTRIHVSRSANTLLLTWNDVTLEITPKTAAAMALALANGVLQIGEPESCSMILRPKDGGAKVGPQGAS